MRSAVALPSIARTQAKLPTPPASNIRSAIPSSATGEFQARHAYQLATTAPKASIPQSAVSLLFFQNPGNAAVAAIPSANIAGPQLQGRVCGPIPTANTSAMTKKTEENAGIWEEKAEKLKTEKLKWRSPCAKLSLKFQLLSFSAFQLLLHAAPLPKSTAGIVRIRILMSNHSDQLSM